MHRFLKPLQIIGCFWLLIHCQVSADDEKARTILFFGDSLTAAYGLDPSQGYPALVEGKIKEKGLNWDVAVGAVSGDTSAGGLSRINWMLQRKVDIFVLALGGNDGLRGVDTEATYANLQQIIDRVCAKYPQAKIVIAGMQLPPSLGAHYTETFAAMYPKLAKANDATLIPFLLKGVGGVRRLNLPDGIHPNAEGQKILAETVWQTLNGFL